jgi:hypothetical protein
MCLTRRRFVSSRCTVIRVESLVESLTYDIRISIIAYNYTRLTKHIDVSTRALNSSTAQLGIAITVNEFVF